MTIDEMLKRIKEKMACDYNISGCDTCNISSCEDKDIIIQLAEWLEELKMLRELKEEHRKIGNIEGFNKGYNKAIDDFVCAVKRRFPNDKNGIFHIELIAEQLKAGGTE